MALSVHECVIERLGVAGRDDFAEFSPNESQPSLWQARVVASFGTAKLRLTASVADAVPIAWGVPQHVVEEAARECVARIYQIGPAMSVFDWWMKLHADTHQHPVNSLPVTDNASPGNTAAWARRSASVFVRALAERALVLALQEMTGAKVEELLEKNLLKIELGKIYRPLLWQSTSTLLPKPLKQSPRRLIRLRPDGVTAFFDSVRAAAPAVAAATGGSGAAANAAAAGSGHLATDAVADAKAPKGFVLSLSGQPDADAAWVLDVLERISAAGLPVSRMHWGIDGEGRYENADTFANFWELCEQSGAVGRAEFGRPAFVIQPLASGLALGNAMVALFARWPRRPSVLLDGGHDGPLSGALALDRGYGGFCFRGARGPILAVADACLLALRQKHEPLGKWMLLGGGSATAQPQPWLEQDAWQRVLGLADVIAPMGLEV